MIFRLAIIALMLVNTYAFAGGKELLQGELSQLLSPRTAIKLRRTGCTAECPTYDVTVYGDGRVVYEGYENVPFQRVVRLQIKPEKVLAILREFREIDYFTLADKIMNSPANCSGLSPDQPSAFTSIKINGFTEKTSHYLGCHGSEMIDQLSSLEDSIDEIVGTAKWAKYRE